MTSQNAENDELVERARKMREFIDSRTNVHQHLSRPAQYNIAMAINVGKLSDVSETISDLLACIAALKLQMSDVLTERDQAVADMRFHVADAVMAWNIVNTTEDENAALKSELVDSLMFLDNAVSKSPQPLKDLGIYLSSLLDDDQWPKAEQYLNAAAKSCVVLPMEVVANEDATYEEDGFITWAGGDRPVNGDVVVAVKVRGQIPRVPVEAKYWPQITWRWRNENDPMNVWDIVAYKVVNDER